MLLVVSSVIFFFTAQTLITGTNSIQNLITKYDQQTNPVFRKIVLPSRQFNNQTKTLTTKRGTLQILGAYTEKGIFMTANDNHKKRIIIVKMKYTNTSKHKGVRPHDLINEYLSASQNNQILDEGYLNVEEYGGSKFNDLANNAVKLYNPGESNDVIAVFGYEGSAPVTLNIGGKQIVYQPDKLEAK